MSSALAIPGVHVELPGPVALAAQEGPQSWLISCPIEDVLFGGARGGGKTYGVLLDWISYQDMWGVHARGILFRRSYRALQEVERLARRIFPGLGAYYVAKDRTWCFPNGATLAIHYLKRDKEADDFQGHQFTWVCFEELTQYANSAPVDLLRATLRNGDAPVPKYFRATANPGGIGHHWVKARYIDPAPACTPFYDEAVGIERCYIPSRIEDNTALMLNDPEYWKNVRASVGDNKALLRAWRWGIWDIAAGGMFDGAFRRAVHVIKPFLIPKSWYVNRSFDWGSSAPFSVLWWAESDGTTAPNGYTYPRGTLFLIAQWYGCVPGKPNVGIRMDADDIAKGIVAREKRLSYRVHPGPADTMIYNVVNGMCLADDMKKEGISWTEANKNPGSRVTGTSRFLMMLKAARKKLMEKAGIFVFDTCTEWIRTVPVLPRDEMKPDDVDTRAEDHDWDATRYRVLEKRAPTHRTASSGTRPEGERVRSELIG